MSKDFKILIGALIIIVLGLGGWYLFPRFIPAKPSKSLLQQVQEQEKLQGFAQETRLIIGKVTAVQENTLTIEAYLPSQPSQDVNAPQIPTTRKIIIGDKTILNKVISLPKERKGDQIIYATTMVKIKPEDLKTGDTIEIYANEDIKYKVEIAPQEIRLTNNK